MTDTAAISKQSLTRRGLLATGASVLALTAVAPSAFAQSARNEIPESELMAETGLPDMIEGDPNAKVTVIEYASMTCGHCAYFHNNVYPELKKKYVDTGKVKFIVREFPLDNLAAAASMLARCAGDSEKRAAFKNVLFKRRSDWVVRGNPVPRLFEISKQAGFTQESFNKCLTDQDLLKKISDIREKASKQFGVNSTPTFFINGKRLMGRSDQIATFDEALKPLLDAS